jgi:putative redox protein
MRRASRSITAGGYELSADEPLAVGGTQTGPDPYQLLLAALGSCTSMTVALYARRKQWALKRVRVRLAHSKVWVQDCAHCETEEGRIDRIEQELELEGDLSAINGKWRSRSPGSARSAHSKSEVDIMTRLADHAPD